MRNKFNNGVWVRHFKRDSLDDLSLSNYYKYLYQIVGYGKDTENEKEVVIYQSLYNNIIWVRPLDDFMSKVDKDKYPNAKQEYKFEAFNSYKDNELIKGKKNGFVLGRKS